MTTAGKVFRYQLRELVRGRAVAGYAAFALIVTAGLLHFGGGPGRALPSLATVVVLVVPLVSLLMTTSSVYHGGDFVEMLLAHPVGRRPLFVGMYLGVALPLAAAFVLGTGLPLVSSGALASFGAPVGLLLVTGTLLTTVFTSIGFLVALRVREAATGLGVALVLWLALAVVYDGAVLLAAYRWASYPLEVPMLVLMALNPVDVARVLVVMALDASAMMGYTGAVFQDFFGGPAGVSAALACLLFWTLAPGLAALRVFRKKDF